VRRRFPFTILLARRIIAAGPTAEVLTPANLDAARRALDADFDEALCSHPHGDHSHGAPTP
jgi:zinc/manganese transport system ATP-binding protein